MKTESQPMTQPRAQGEARKAAPAQPADLPPQAPVAVLPQPEPSSASTVEALQEELRGLQDRHLRLAADFDNFKKRTAQETEIRSAAKKEVFILELLPVLDSLDRALAGDGAVSRDQLYVGVEMISHQLLHLLSRHDIQPDDCLGRAFDSHRHEAVGIGWDAAQPSQAVLQVCRRGWLKGKEVLRPAQVIVNDLDQSKGQSSTSQYCSHHD
jgi:molecular chaperone GrpE